MRQNPAGIATRQQLRTFSNETFSWQQSLCSDRANSNVLSLFQAGLWVRPIETSNQHPDDSITREVNILRKRSKLSDKVLSLHNPRIDTKNHEEFSYSPSTFVKKKFSIKIFEKTGFGVLINIKRPITAWRFNENGRLMGEEGEEIDFGKTNIYFKNQSDDCQFLNITSEEVALKIENIYKNQHRKYSQSVCGELSEKEYPFLCQYNEGMLRYRKSDIVGIYINIEDNKNAFYALKLKKALGLNNLEFYAYKPCGGILVKIDDKKIQYMSDIYCYRFRRNSDNETLDELYGPVLSPENFKQKMWDKLNL